MMTWQQSTRLLACALLPICRVFSAEAETTKTDLCTIMQSPQEYSGRFVSVRAELSRGEAGEWYLYDFSCLTLDRVFVATPYQLKPRPDFRFQDRDSVAMLYMQGYSSGFRLYARFEGRIDWSGADKKQRGRIPRRALFGREKMPLRMVLRKVSEAYLARIPTIH